MYQYKKTHNQYKKPH